MAVTLAACTTGPVQRPLEGAPTGAASAPDVSGVPPTLSPPTPSGGINPGPGSPGPLAFPSPSPSPPPGIAGFVIVATDGAGANMRDGPSTRARVLTTLREGTPVEVLGQPVTTEGRAWQQIRGGGHEGWVVAVVVRRR